MLSSKLNLLILTTLFCYGLCSDTEVDKVKKYLTYKIDQMKQHFERNLNQMKDEMNEMKGQTANNTCGEDWIPYVDTKCYKVLEKRGSEAEAKEQCANLDPSSTLLTIQSEDEQNFLSNLLLKHNEVTDNVWIGLEANGEVLVNKSVVKKEQDKSENDLDSEEEESVPESQEKPVLKKTYKWMDDNDLRYHNWDENADKDKDCVKMSLTKSSLGKWTDGSCNKKYSIVCQTKQWTPAVMSQEIQSLTNAMKKQVNVLKDQSATIKRQQTEISKLKGQLEDKPKDTNDGIPIGFIYTQLPKQSDPETLWPNTKWQEVTEEYAGLFFRAEGGDSEPFGENQEENQSRISEIYFKGGYFNFFSNYYYPKQYNTTLVPKKWKDINHEESLLTIHTLKFYTTGGEVRPVNTAVKIWKRVQ